MAAKSVSPASPLGEKHIFENQTVKLGMTCIVRFARGRWRRLRLVDDLVTR